MPGSMRWRIAVIVALYATLAGLWIYLSDGLVALLATTPARLTRLQTGKGWAFVAATALLLGLILRHEARARLAHEAALRDSEETYRTLVEVESDAVFLIDNASGQLLAANPAAAQLYGYPRAELLGLRNIDLSAQPTETARVTTTTPLAPETRISIPLRYHKKRDGTVFPVEITGRFFIWRGRPVHLAAIRDITERQAAEATLARYRLLVEQARDIVFFLSREGRILEANRAAVQAYGYSAGELATLCIQDLRSAEARPLTAEHLAKADSDGLLFETVHRRKDGTTFPVEVSSRGTALDGRRVLLSIIRDITARQQAERALQASLNEKIVLLKEVHHRVKNNLQIVASLLNLEAGRAHLPAMQTVLREIRNRVHAMAMLHERLYRSEDLARIDFAVYVAELCRHLQGSVRLPAGRVAVETVVAPLELPLDQAVPCGLIINELVSNALKHGFPGDRSGSVRVEVTAAAPPEVVVRVSDDGVGLPPEFAAAEATTLGLRLVANLAGQLRGRLVTEARPGPGAAFRVEFPLPVQKKPEEQA
jgi:PAS domain S-box-containing protein